MQTNKLLIIDLEATCWNDRPKEYSFQNSEIIEVGATLIDMVKREIIESRSYLVKPENTKISEFCTTLTSITEEMVNDSNYLKLVIEQINKDFKIKNLTWGSWGFYDFNQLRKECLRKSISNPFGERNFINLKKMVALNNSWSKEKGIENALKSLSMVFEGTPHRGIDDTKNIAKIILK
jgi:inhibitor of KinA sporulation pathway (predicted exonuclease)